jgi:hypothetical protein
MRATDTLAHATLADSLNAACFIIADTILKGGPRPALRIPGALIDYVDDYIPGQVLNLAVYAGWLPQPSNPAEGHNGGPFGHFIVDQRYKDWFIGLIEQSLSNLRASASNDDDLGVILALRENVKGEIAAPTDANETVMPEWGESFRKAQVSETSAAERKALEENFLATHKHLAYKDDYLIQELAWMADVHQKQWERWRRAEIANNSIPGRKILRLLERNQPTRDSRKIPERKREKLGL